MIKKIKLSLYIAILIYGIVSSYLLKWVCDDAFISFRYANNLWKGHGLVYNIGEKVEGYTNFLWTILIYIGIFFNQNPIILSEFLGLTSYIGILIVLYFFGKYLSKESFYHYIPISFSMYALQKHSSIFATSGLETSFFTFLILSGYFFIFHLSNNKIIFLGSLLLVLSAMTRPEGILYYAIGFLFLLASSIQKEISWKVALLSTIPFLFLYLPYFLWRYNYYGWLFPNTYYAKSGGDSYWQQGVQYFLLYFQAYYILWLVPILIVFWIYKKIQLSTLDSKLLFLLAAPTFHSIYIIKAGGDFMFARFWIPITPFLFLLLERLVQNLFKKKLFLLYSMLCLSILLYYNPYQGTSIPIIYGISNEHEIYKPSTVKFISQKLIQWKPYIEKANLRIAIGGSQAIYGYYLENNYILEAEAGLTDEFLAHQTITSRKRIGHEKRASLEYLQEKKIDIHFNPADLEGSQTNNRIQIDGMPGDARVIIHNKSKIDTIKQIPDFHF